MATQRIYTSGQLNQQIQLQERAVGANGLGEATGAWVARGQPIWAAVWPLRGAERLAAGGLQQTLDVIAVIRYRPGITASLRFLWRGEPYDILAAVPVDGGQEWIELSAITGARDGR